MERFKYSRVLRKRNICELIFWDNPSNTGQFTPNTSFYEKEDNGDFIPF